MSAFYLGGGEKENELEVHSSDLNDTKINMEEQCLFHCWRVPSVEFPWLAISEFRIEALTIFFPACRKAGIYGNWKSNVWRQAMEKKYSLILVGCIGLGLVNYGSICSHASYTNYTVCHTRHVVLAVTLKNRTAGVRFFCWFSSVQSCKCVDLYRLGHLIYSC